MKAKLFLLVFYCAAVLFIPASGLRGAGDPLVKKALRWHNQVLTVDTHCDTPFKLLEKGWDIGQYHQPGQRGSGCQDLPRMKAGGLDASFFAVFVGQGPRTPEGHANGPGKSRRHPRRHGRHVREIPGPVRPRPCRRRMPGAWKSRASAPSSSAWRTATPWAMTRH